MDNKNELAFETLTESEVRFGLLAGIVKERYSASWDELKTELKTTNRFFPNASLLEYLDEMISRFTAHYAKGMKLYRARIFDLRHRLDDLYELYVEKSVPPKSHMKLLKGSISIYPILLSAVKRDIMPRELLDIVERLREDGFGWGDDGFGGYDKGRSDAPPPGTAREGRLNPKGISYLYTAADIDTAICEMRPTLTDILSVATVELHEDVKLFDLTNIFLNNEEFSFLEMYSLSLNFSKPKSSVDDESEYLASQFVAEYLKANGFDGIAYKSAINEAGINIVLFQTTPAADKKKLYEIISSSLFSVKRISYEVESVRGLDEC